MKYKCKEGDVVHITASSFVEFHRIEEIAVCIGDKHNPIFEVMRKDKIITVLWLYDNEYEIIGKI